MSSNDILAEARARAASRAAILQGLQQDYASSQKAAAQKQQQTSSSVGGGNSGKFSASGGSAKQKKKDHKDNNGSNSNKRSFDGPQREGESHSEKKSTTASSTTATTSAPLSTAPPVDGLSASTQSKLVADMHSNKTQLDSTIDMILRQLAQTAPEGHSMKRTQGLDKMRQLFRDTLNGKAIVLDNASLQKKASTSEQKNKKLVSLSLSLSLSLT